MAVFSIARRTTSGVSAEPAMAVRTTATQTCRLLEAHLFLAAATTSTYGLGRPAAVGVTPTSPVTVLSEDIANGAVLTGTVTTALAWGTKPTVPAQFFRRISLPATIGSGVIWTFPRGLAIPVTGEIVWWNLATNGVVDAVAVVEE
jgi:hypothetical protein